MGLSAFLPSPPTRLAPSPFAGSSCLNFSSASSRRNQSVGLPLVGSKTRASLSWDSSRRWSKVVIGVAGLAIGCALPNVSSKRSMANSLVPMSAIASEKSSVRVIDGSSSVPLTALGIRQEDYVSHRELARRKTTQYSEAEEEIMELEEDEVESQWFRDLRMMYAGVASIGGIMVLYKGGVLWEGWIQEQERKDIEEEIELTGTFIDPRAVRKEEDDEKKKKKGDDGDSSGPLGKSGPGSGSPGSPSDDLPGGIDALERLFGKS